MHSFSGEMGKTNAVIVLCLEEHRTKSHNESKPPVCCDYMKLGKGRGELML